MNSHPSTMRPFKGGPARSAGVRPARPQIRPDPFTLIVLAIMSLLTISTPAVELFNIPRITLVSLPFTAYMLMRLGGRLVPQLVMFVLCYILAFLPSTVVAMGNNEIKYASFFQGLIGLFTMVVVGSYFHNWLSHNSFDKIKRQFLRLSWFFTIVSLTELIFYTQFFALYQIIYDSENSVRNSLSLYRELSLYGGRPMSLFSEPSHFARFIGLMMAAFIAATEGTVASLWAGGAFLLLTRSVSYFFALPVLVMQALYAVRAKRPRSGKSSGMPLGLRILGITVLIGAVMAVVAYTQSERIAGGLSTGTTVGGNVSGDGSLNERLLIPIGYFFEGDKSVLIGLGPTPQDEMQKYTVYKTRLIYNWNSIRYDFYSAVSASIFVVIGMGYVGVIIFAALLFFTMNRLGLIMMAAFLLSNLLSSGYNSTTSLVPSGLLFAIILFQRSRERKGNSSFI